MSLATSAASVVKRPRWRSWWASRWVLWVACMLAAWWCGDPAIEAAGNGRDQMLRTELAATHDLLVDPSSRLHWAAEHVRVKWLPSPVWVAARARRATSDAHDIYLVRAELSPEGSLLRLDGLYNLTQTDLANETGLAGDGPRLTWHLEGQGQTYRVEYADLRGEPPPRGEEWTALARWQRQLTQLQHVGQLRGVRRRSFRIEPAAPELDVSLAPGVLRLRVQGQLTEISTDGVTDFPDAAPIHEESRQPARPGNLLTWAVDRARDFEWLGTERIQWLKAVSFSGLDWIDQALTAEAGAEWVEEPAPPAARAPADFAPETGWPPAALDSAVTPALQGEGEWRPLDSDPFVKQHPGLPAPFITTFVRPDPRHPNARVISVMWDPRRVDLHFAAGTEEPKSATGEVGTGIIPRTPAVMSRLLGAFNGGFQSAHGAWGMLVDGKLLVPPRAYAATVARLDDGAVAFGTWPLTQAVPANLNSFRQNLTPLVSDGLPNPYGRDWWGGVPIGWKDVTRSTRSALCLTEDGFVGYFYGSRIDHEELASALIRARCNYALHLDMNAGHTGFEFYSVVPRSEAPLPPDQLATRWKAEGDVPELPELRYRARKMFRNMQLMHFPRYIQRQTRDFFYLTERSLLPPARLERASQLADPEAGAWRVATGSGFPHAFASTWLRPDSARPETRVHVLALDLKWLSVQLAEAGPLRDGSLLTLSLPPERAGARALWLSEHVAQIGLPPAGSQVIARETPETAPRAAWGTRTEEVLIYAEIVVGPDPDRDAALLEGVLTALGCSSQLITGAPSLLALVGEPDLTGQPVSFAAAAKQPALHFRRYAWQAQRRLFPDTEIVAPETWQPHQP